MPEGRWVATCPSCSKRYSKHRKPKAPTGGRFYYCPPCWKGLSYLPKAERAKLSELTFVDRSEEHTSELQSLMRISYAVFCLKKKNNNNNYYTKLIDKSTM